MSRCRWTSRGCGRSSRVFGRRVATVVDAGNGCGRAIPGRCRRDGDGGGKPRAEGEGVGGGPEASAGDSLLEGGGAVSGGLGSGGDGLGPVPGRWAAGGEGGAGLSGVGGGPRDSVAVHADETGWQVGGPAAWLWVFTGPQGTVCTIDRRWPHEVAVEVLRQGFSGVWVTDCFRAYDHRVLADWPQQKCFAHLLRELARLLREALALREEKGKSEPAWWEARLEGWEVKLDALMAEERRFTDRDNERFAWRLRKRRRHLLRFLRVEGVEATNNRAERALRPALLVRKTGAVTRPLEGPEPMRCWPACFKPCGNRTERRWPT